MFIAAAIASDVELLQLIVIEDRASRGRLLPTTHQANHEGIQGGGARLWRGREVGTHCTVRVGAFHGEVRSNHRGLLQKGQTFSDINDYSLFLPCNTNNRLAHAHTSHTHTYAPQFEESLGDVMRILNSSVVLISLDREMFEADSQ